MSEADPTAARELLLFIENTAALYHQQYVPIFADGWYAEAKAGNFC